MIDLHAHILPCLDDGAETMSEAIEMARVAHADGVCTIVATPHVGIGEAGSWGEIQARVEALQSAISEAGVPVRILPGAELMLSPALPRLLAGPDRPFRLNGSRYVLVELPLQQYPFCAEEAFFALQLKGIVPILAHPERYTYIQRDLGILARLAQRGILMQITGGSLLGEFGGRARQVAETIIHRQMAHFLGSDGHSPDSRPPVLAEARAGVARIAGEERAIAMTSIGPARVIADQPLPVPEPALQRERRR